MPIILKALQPRRGAWSREVLVLGRSLPVSRSEIIKYSPMIRAQQGTGHTLLPSPACLRYTDPVYKLSTKSRTCLMASSSVLQMLHSPIPIPSGLYVERPSTHLPPLRWISFSPCDRRALHNTGMVDMLIPEPGRTLIDKGPAESNIHVKALRASEELACLH